MFSREQKEKFKKVLLVAPLFILFNYGCSLSGIIGRVLFVERIGSEFLPYAYVVSAILGGIFAISVSNFLKKLSLAKLLQIFSWLGALLFFGNYILMAYDSFWSYVLFFTVSTSFYLILAGTVIWRIAGNISSLFETKSIFIYYSLAYSLGGVLAGISTSYLETIWGMEKLIIPVSISLVLAAINLLLIQNKYHEQLQPVAEDGEKLSYFASLKKDFLDFKKTRLAKMLFIGITIFNIVWWMSDYEFQKIAGDALTEDEYSQVSGILTIVNHLLLILTIFVETWVMKKAGVLQSLLLSPLLVLISFALLFFFPTPAFAFILNVTTPLIGLSIFTSSTQSAFTALPNSIRNKVATFVSGNSDAFAMLFAGLFLVFLTEFFDNIWIIAIACALLFLDAILIWMTKKIYLQQVLINLGSTNQIDMRGAIENLAEQTYRDVGVQELMKLMSWRKLDSETSRKIIFALGEIGNVNVIPSLLERFKTDDTNIKYSIVETIHSFPKLKEKLKDLPFTRLSIVENYEKIFLEEEDQDLKVFILERLGDFDPDNVITFLRNTLNDKSQELQRKAITAMRFFNDRGIISYIKPHLESEDPLTHSAVITALWQFPELKPLLMKYVVQIMAGSSKEHIIAALTVIGTLKFSWEKTYVQKQLENSDKTIKQMAALTLMQLNDASPIPMFISELTKKSADGIFFARALKKIPLNLKKSILREIQRMEEADIKACMENLDASYLNFNDEIEFMTGESSNRHFSKL